MGVVAFPAALAESVAAGAARVLVFLRLMCRVAAAISSGGGHR